MNAHVRWTSEPDMCRCPAWRKIMATLEATLACPAGFRARPDGRWEHAVWGPR